MFELGRMTQHQTYMLGVRRVHHARSSHSPEAPCHGQSVLSPADRTHHVAADKGHDGLGLRARRLQPPRRCPVAHAECRRGGLFPGK